MNIVKRNGTVLNELLLMGIKKTQISALCEVGQETLSRKYRDGMDMSYSEMPLFMGRALKEVILHDETFLLDLDFFTNKHGPQHAREAMLAKYFEIVGHKEGE